MNTLRTALISLLKLYPAASRSVVVAVSGGVDSLSLLHALATLILPQKPHIIAVTVDHQLRVESSTEADHVAAFCSLLSIPHHILTWEGEKPTTHVQKSARDARYQLLSDFAQRQGVPHVLLAHHNDDQVETFFLRLFKGSGLHGLRGMDREIAYGNVTFVRPLLCVSKNTLRDYAHEHNLPSIDDPSNKNERFGRVQVRNFLKDVPTEGILLSMERLRESDALLQTIINQTLENVGGYEDGAPFLEYDTFFALPLTLQVEVLRKFISGMIPSPYPMQSQKVKRLRAALEHKKTHTLGQMSGKRCVWKVRRHENGGRRILMEF